MKMFLAKLKIFTIKVLIIVFVMIIALMQVKYEFMGIRFIQQNVVFLVMEERLQKGLPPTTLHNG